MKTSYQRELKRNYLIVEMEKSDTREEPPFEQKMLEQNQIDGILHFQVQMCIRDRSGFISDCILAVRADSGD